ncbi:MAG: leucine-rich repeat protein [Ruminococcus sp.]|nr:leucine-rich repeat protein [Ruminococcus sp.]
MKRQLISSLLALSMVFGAAAYLPEGGTAQSEITAKADIYGEYEYTVLKDGTVEINKYNGTDTDVTIPSTIGGKRVTSIGDSAFYTNLDLKSITIPDGVKSFGYTSFNGCTSLSKVNIPDSVTSIDTAAFSWCTSLTDIKIPDSVTSIGDAAFYRCSQLTSIKLPVGINRIGAGTFELCSRLTSITIPKSVTSIGERTFLDTQWLKNKQDKSPLVIVNNILIDGSKCSGSVTLPSSVTSISNYAFENGTSLTSVKIPYGKKNIGDNTFYFCTSLTSVFVPKSVKTIGNYAFYNCNEKSITVPSSVTYIGFNALGYHVTEGLVTPQHVPFFKIICIKGSQADKYAKDNEFKVSYKKTMAFANVKVNDKVFTGKPQKPAVTVKFGKKTLKKGTDYTVSYKNNKKIGTATVTVKGKGSYTGKVSKTFKINPKKTTVKKLTTPKTKQLKVTYKKVSGVTGYQITYSTSSKYTKSTTKTVNVTSTSKTIKSLKKGKTYYVKVRSYKTVNGTKYYSTYSKVKSIKVK